MQNFYLIFWFLWESFLIINAHPVSSEPTGNNEEFYWLKYVFGFFGIITTAFTLMGCLCCNKNNRSKGFKEFQNERTNDHELSFQHSFEGLESDISQIENSKDKVEFNFLTESSVIRQIYRINEESPNFEDDTLKIEEFQRKWSNSVNFIHLSREKLKYLREIGQGWFGKIIEGCIDEKNFEENKIGNVVVRILSDEATDKEKLTFLVEAKPYFKLRHRNILALIGCCLEADPYLLIFESCAFGDLKYFLQSNRDSKSRSILSQENISTHMALDVIAGLQYMHDNGFSHTDLSARNCLVSSDLSVKLGDYGNGVEKYPSDYYVISGRALPIRWSAPESFECSNTTIETREITPCANIWSFAILLWEIITWGERPYDELNDEQVIQMLLSKSELKTTILQSLLHRFQDQSNNLLEVLQLCLNVDSSERISLNQVHKILVKGYVGEKEFDHLWQNLRFNSFKDRRKSASLRDLRGSDDYSWPSFVEDKNTSRQTRFKLGPQELIKNTHFSNVGFLESDSENEEDSWRMKVECGAYTEKVKQKSKSVTDLMVLVHIDPDSDADWSLGSQVIDKSINKKPTFFGSDSDLQSKIFINKFDQKLKQFLDVNTENEIRSTSKIDSTFYDLDNIFKQNGNVNASKSASQSKHVLHDKVFEKPVFDNELNKNEVKSPNRSVSCDGNLKSIHAEKNEKQNLNSDGIQNAMEKDTDFPSSKEHLKLHFLGEEKCNLQSPLNNSELPLNSSELPLNNFQLPLNNSELPLNNFQLPLNTSQLPSNNFPNNYNNDEANEEDESVNKIETNNGLRKANEVKLEKESQEIVKMTTNNESSDTKSICGNKDQSNTNNNNDSTISSSIFSRDLSTQKDESRIFESSSSLNLDTNNTAERVVSEFSNKLNNTQANEDESLELGGKELAVSNANNDDNWNYCDFQDESDEPSSVNISIRYNLYNLPLSPIVEEQESIANSESILIDESKDNTSIVSNDSEDFLVMDNVYEDRLLKERRANEIVNHDIRNDLKSDQVFNINVAENSRSNFQNYNTHRKENIRRKATKQDKSNDDDDDSDDDDDDDEDENYNKDTDNSENGKRDTDDDEDDDNLDDKKKDDDNGDSENDEDDFDDPDINNQADVEENSSSSEEFIYKQYNKSDSTVNDIGAQNFARDVDNERIKIEEGAQITEDVGKDIGAIDESVYDEREEEFTPSSWDANLTPHRSVLRSPDKILKSPDQKKSVCFKKQWYHCVYEYPKEVYSTFNENDEVSKNWEFTSYSDWEDMMNKTRHDFHNLNDESISKDEEFHISSSNYPFQLETIDSTGASQFFPGSNVKNARQSQLQNDNQFTALLCKEEDQEQNNSHDNNADEQ